MAENEDFIERLVGDMEYASGVKFGEYRPAALKVAEAYVKQAMAAERGAIAAAVLDSMVRPWSDEAYRIVLSVKRPIEF